MCPNPHINDLVTEAGAIPEVEDETVATKTILDGDARLLTVNLAPGVSLSFRQTSGASLTQPPKLS